MEKILEKIKEIWGRIVQWWSKFDSKQKTVVVAIALGVILAFVGLYTLLSRPNYTLLKNCSDATEGAQIVELLDENNIKYKTNDAGTRITVPKKSLAEANLALASSGITPNSYDIDTALSGGFTVTEADKQKRYELYLEDKLAKDFLAKFNAIKSAVVDISLAENDGTLLSQKEESTVSVVLEIDGDFDETNAASLAQALAGCLHKSNTEGVVIMDMDANLLFSGSDEQSHAGNASSLLGVKTEAESLTNAKVKNVLSNTGQFGDIKVSSNLNIDFSSREHTTHTYTPADGQSQGVLGEEEYYASEAQGGGGGTPGTDSNNESTYQYATGEYSTSTIEEYYKKYLPNEDIEYTQIPAGVVDYSQSNVAVSSIKYIVIKEDDVKKAGELDGISWDEYKRGNAEKRKVAVNEEMITLVHNATGIPEEQISIVAYEENVFVDKERASVDMANVIQIVLIILILVLLAIVVLKSMKTVKEEEQPEELSVENLLQSNPVPTEPGLDDIEMEESSETKKAIEKFVDENPEAVANLLRNWLNEEWG